MSDEPKTISGREVLPWPDAEGWWWSKATGHCLHAVRSIIPKTFIVLKYNEVYQQHEWEEDGPDRFCRCEENPFKEPA